MLFISIKVNSKMLYKILKIVERGLNNQAYKRLIKIIVETKLETRRFE